MWRGEGCRSGGPLCEEDAERVAGADLDFASFEREGDDAFDAVDGLLVGVVAVGDGDFGSGGDVELEDGDGATGVLAFDQETNCQLPHPYLFASAGCHVCSGVLPFLRDHILSGPFRRWVAHLTESRLAASSRVVAASLHLRSLNCLLWGI